MADYLKQFLAVLARATLRRYNPLIIGITGSVGKTSTRQAVFTVLKAKYRVRAAEKNYNNEIGLPLAVLGLRYYGKNIFGWLGGLARSALRFIYNDSRYPEILVLEYGVDRPGDMEYLLSIARPRIAVVTAIGEIPAHAEFFESAEELIKEKAKIVSLLPADGYTILNNDDRAVSIMREKTAARVLTFGTEKFAEVRIINGALSTIHNERGAEIPEGIAFKLEYKGSVVPVRLAGTFGLPQAYAAAAAAGVGLVLGMNLIEVSNALRGYQPLAGRMRTIAGRNHALILDDTYNASPEAMRSALETFKSMPAMRKIAVLGDMLELGRFGEQAHRAIGEYAAGFIDILFCVGPCAAFIADEALMRGAEGAGAQFISEDQVRIFDDALSAAAALASTIGEGDIILVKGSQGMRMERIVAKIMAEPQRAQELLVRQEADWRRK